MDESCKVSIAVVYGQLKYRVGLGNDGASPLDVEISNFCVAHALTCCMRAAELEHRKGGPVYVTLQVDLDVSRRLSETCLRHSPKKRGTPLKVIETPHRCSRAASLPIRRLSCFSVAGRLLLPLNFDINDCEVCVTPKADKFPFLRR
jgi:hypothetical protein